MNNLRLNLLFVLMMWVTIPQSMAQNQPVRVACVGNSITYGYGLKDRTKDAYPAQLQRMLGAKYEVRNFGHSGTTLLSNGHRPYIHQSEFKEALAFKPNIVVIHLGINDTDPRNWPYFRDRFVEDYVALIDSFRVAEPSCRVIIAKMTPISHRHRRFIAGTRDWHKQIQSAIRSVASYKGLQMVNLYEPLLPYPGLLEDGLHPNSKGAGIMAKQVYGAITGDFGGLSMAPVYASGMVLQHGRAITISGKANSREKVTVSIAGQLITAETNDQGEWQAELQPLKAGGPYHLVVSTPQRELSFDNVLAGEVWLCSGQSNMEFYLTQSLTGARDIPRANDDYLRLYDMKERWRTDAVEWPVSALDSINDLQYYRDAQWLAATPKSVTHFSAVAYYFGRMLRDSLQVPIGLISNAVGGSTTESWIDRQTLEDHFPEMLQNWRSNELAQAWARGRATQNIAKHNEPLQRHPYEPAYLYESGIAPLESFPIKGVIWYQGESNAQNFETHERLFSLLPESWRKVFGYEGGMPFYFVQLSSLTSRPEWAWFRDSQRRLAERLPQVGMAVSSDQGDRSDVHPKSKQPIGERLALLALHKTYGHQAIAIGPWPQRVEFRDGSARVWMDHAEGLTTSDGQPLRGFEVAEYEGLFYPATATIHEDGSISLRSDKVVQPKYVRYGWGGFSEGNLVNEAGLPATTFRLPAFGK